ncbi:MAG TPA: hypothetical protein VIG99_07525 [Myxococcaceae bacterium]|jgi:hypothetical protein
MKRTMVLVAAAMALVACKGEKGDAGDQGPQGPQGQQGVRGDTGASGATPDVSFVGRLLEAESPSSSAVTAGVTAADPTASGGNVRFAAGSGAAGSVYAIINLDLGGKLGVGRTEVTVRAKVTSNLSSAVLAQFRCDSVRAGTGSPTAVSPLLDIRPNEFASGQWRELTIRCNFLPDDVSQAVVMDSFTPGITDLTLDYVRITPLPSATRLLGQAGCLNCATTTETFTAYMVAKAAGAPVETTVTTSGGPVLVMITLGMTMNPVVRFYCSIRVRNAGGTVLNAADVYGSTGTSADRSCSGSYVFNLPAGRYTFEADGWTQTSSAVTWSYSRQISVWEM